MAFYHRRCGGCGDDVTVYSTQHEDFDVLCQQCRMDLTAPEHLPDEDGAPDV